MLLLKAIKHIYRALSPRFVVCGLRAMQFEAVSILSLTRFDFSPTEFFFFLSEVSFPCPPFIFSPETERKKRTDKHALVVATLILEFSHFHTRLI
jgi:hypothetical protein